MIRDARGKNIAFTNEPTRIVSLVPSLTELLASLDLNKQTVGLTRFCDHPSGWKSAKTIVGGTKNVNVDTVRDLAPDLVIANKEENERDVVEALDAFTEVHVTEVASLPSALTTIRDVGKLTCRSAAADTLAAEIEQRFGRIQNFAPTRVAYLIWRDPWMTVGGDTFIHDMLQRAGFANVFGDVTRYPTVTLDDIREQKPKVVFLSSEPYPFDEDHRDAFQADSPNATVHCVRGDLFSWYGSRLLKSPAYFSKLRRDLKAY